MTLGNRIMELRARAGLSQEEFGELFGATRQTVSRWELDLAIPEVQKIVQMAKTFGVTTDSIIGDGVSTFDMPFKRFVCGIYRKKDTVIADTERLTIVFKECKDALRAELYEGVQENKILRAFAEFDMNAKKAKYAYSDDGGKITSNCAAEEIIGKKFERAQLNSMKRVETFFVRRDSKPLPTVPEAGFKTCLTKWRTGTKFHCKNGEIFAGIYVGGMEYAFHMAPEMCENIYVSIVANEAFELGNCVGRQYFRIRNFGDNTEKFTVSFSLLNEEFTKVSLPSGENGIVFDHPASAADNEDGRTVLESVKKYTPDSITVTNCGDELTYLKDDGDMVERFEV